MMKCSRNHFTYPQAFVKQRISCGNLLNFSCGQSFANCLQKFTE